MPGTLHTRIRLRGRHAGLLYMKRFHVIVCVGVTVMGIAMLALRAFE